MTGFLFFYEPIFKWQLHVLWIHQWVLTAAFPLPSSKGQWKKQLISHKTEWAAASLRTKKSWSVFSNFHLHHPPCDTDSLSLSLLCGGVLPVVILRPDKEEEDSYEILNPPRNTIQSTKAALYASMMGWRIWQQKNDIIFPVNQQPFLYYHDPS